MFQKLLHKSADGLLSTSSSSSSSSSSSAARHVNSASSSVTAADAGGWRGLDPVIHKTSNGGRGLDTVTHKTSSSGGRGLDPMIHKTSNGGRGLDSVTHKTSNGHPSSSEGCQLSRPNMPLTISEHDIPSRAGTAAVNVTPSRHSSVSATQTKSSCVQAPDCAGDRSTQSVINNTSVSVNSSVQSKAVNHPSPGSCVCDVPSDCAAGDVTLSNKTTERSKRCAKSTTAHETYCNTAVSDSCTNSSTTPYTDKLQVEAECVSERRSVKGVKHSPSKWNCCVNVLQKHHKVKRSNSSSKNCEIACVCQPTPVCASDTVCQPQPTALCASDTRHSRDTSKSETQSRSGKSSSSVVSTTAWRVTVRSDDNKHVSQCSHGDVVQATTAWRVSDIVNKCSSATPAHRADTTTSHPAHGDDNAALTVHQSSAGPCNATSQRAVQHVLNGVCLGGETHSTPVRPTVISRYHQLLLLFI